METAVKNSLLALAIASVPDLLTDDGERVIVLVTRREPIAGGDGICDIDDTDDDGNAIVRSVRLIGREKATISIIAYHREELDMLPLVKALTAGHVVNASGVAINCEYKGSELTSYGKYAEEQFNVEAEIPLIEDVAAPVEPTEQTIEETEIGGGRLEY